MYDADWEKMLLAWPTELLAPADPRVRGTVHRIRQDYRSANRFAGVKEGRALIEPGRPFLLDSEKSDAPQPLSFDLVRETFQHEYRRRAAASGKLIQVEAPSMTAPGQPIEAANGWKVTTSSSLPDHGPELAADGVVELRSSCGGGPRDNQSERTENGPRITSAFAFWPLTPTFSPAYRGAGVILRPSLSTRKNAIVLRPDIQESPP